MFEWLHSIKMFKSHKESTRDQIQSRSVAHNDDDIKLSDRKIQQGPVHKKLGFTEALLGVSFNKPSLTGWV